MPRTSPSAADGSAAGPVREGRLWVEQPTNDSLCMRLVRVSADGELCLSAPDTAIASTAPADASAAPAPVLALRGCWIELDQAKFWITSAEGAKTHFTAASAEEARAWVGVLRRAAAGAPLRGEDPGKFEAAAAATSADGHGEEGGSCSRPGRGHDSVSKDCTPVSLSHAGSKWSSKRQLITSRRSSASSTGPAASAWDLLLSDRALYTQVATTRPALHAHPLPHLPSRAISDVAASATSPAPAPTGIAKANAPDEAHTTPLLPLPRPRLAAPCDAVRSLRSGWHSLTHAVPKPTPMAVKLQPTLLKGTEVLGQVGLLSSVSLLGFLYRMPSGLLVLLIVLTFVVTGCVSASFLAALDCVDPTDVQERVFLGSLLLVLLQFGGADIPPINDSTACLALVTLNQYFSLILQVACFSILTVRLLMPTSEILFSEKLVIAKRKGRPLLMFRFAHPLGHPLFDTDLNCKWIHFVTTPEGERTALTDTIVFKVPPGAILMPFQVTHHIDDKDSPLRENSEGVILPEGESALHVSLTAYDPVVRVPVHATYLYNLPADIRFNHRFADIIVTGLLTALKDGSRSAGRAQVDLSRFHDTVPLDT